MSNNQLIPIKESKFKKETVQTVNARELHQFLEVLTPFDKWIIRRIEEYGFLENQDFTTILSKSTGGRPAVEMALNNTGSIGQI